MSLTFSVQCEDTNSILGPNSRNGLDEWGDRKVYQESYGSTEPRSSIGVPEGLCPTSSSLKKS